MVLTRAMAWEPALSPSPSPVGEGKPPQVSEVPTSSGFAPPTSTLSAGATRSSPQSPNVSPVPGGGSGGLPGVPFTRGGIPSL